jgi:hypothetical protein
MKKYFLNFLSIFKHKKDTKIYSIQELNQLRQREKKIQLARKSRAYISDLNKRQKSWVEKNNRKSKLRCSRPTSTATRESRNFFGKESNKF